MQDRRREHRGGRAGTRWLLSAVPICWEHQSRAPPQTTAAGHALQLRGKPHIEIYAGGETATSQDRRQDKEEEKRWWEKLAIFCFFLEEQNFQGKRLFTFYFWSPFNNLSSASFWSVKHNFAFVKVWHTGLNFYFQSAFLPIWLFWRF